MENLSQIIFYGVISIVVGLCMIIRPIKMSIWGPLLVCGDRYLCVGTVHILRQLYFRHLRPLPTKQPPLYYVSNCLISTIISSNKIKIVKEYDVESFAL